MGQSNERGDGGIYIGSIMKGGAVAADGRIEPGDMLLQVRTGWKCVQDRNLTQTLAVSVQFSVLFSYRWMTLTLRTCATTMPYECWGRSCISLGESDYKTFMFYRMCLAYQQKCGNSCTILIFFADPCRWLWPNAGTQTQTAALLCQGVSVHFLPLTHSFSHKCNIR